MTRKLLVAGAVLFAGCGGSATGSNGGSPCATTQGIEVCAARTEYRPTDSVTTTIRNTTSEVVFVDGCSVKPVGKTSRSASFETDYLPSAQCGSDVDLTEILANMIEVAPGQSAQVSPRITSFAFQGFYRINVWILDAAGERVSTSPVYSGTFDVFPSAGT